MASPRGRRRIDLAPDGLEQLDGAFGRLARRRARRRVGIGLVGLALVGAAVALYVWLQPANGVGGRGRYAVVVRCETCDRDVQTRVSFQHGFPAPCPVCKRLTAYPVWACRRCEARFRADVEASVQVCPECGSADVGTAVSVP